MKHARRRYRLRHRGYKWTYDAATQKWSRAGQRYKHVIGAKLWAGDHRRFHGHANFVFNPGEFIYGRVKYDSATGWGMPHDVWTTQNGTPIVPLHRLHVAILWYHVKRQRRVHKAGRTMSKLQRRVWAANLFYMREGLHSATDPLGRTPNEITWDGISPLYAEGPVPNVHWSAVE